MFYSHGHVVFLKVLLTILWFDFNNTVVAVSLRRRLEKFGQDPNSPPKTTKYMHPFTLKDIKSRSVTKVYERNKRNHSINEYVPSIDQIYSRKIKKDILPGKEHYTLRSRASNYQRKISYEDYSDGGYDSDKLKKAKKENKQSLIKETKVSTKKSRKRHPNKWYWEQKALRESGDKKAIDIHRVSNKKTLEARRKRKDRVYDGTASEKDLKLHQNIKDSSKKYQQTHREKLRAYNRLYRQQQRKASRNSR